MNWEDIFITAFFVGMRLLSAAVNSEPVPVEKAWYVPVQVCVCAHVEFARLQRYPDGQWQHQAPIFLFSKNTPETHAYQLMLVVRVNGEYQTHRVEITQNELRVDGKLVGSWPLESFKKNSYFEASTSMRLKPIRIPVGHADEPLRCLN